MSNSTSATAAVSVVIRTMSTTTTAAATDDKYVKIKTTITYIECPWLSKNIIMKSVSWCYTRSDITTSGSGYV